MPFSALQLIYFSPSFLLLLLYKRLAKSIFTKVRKPAHNLRSLQSSASFQSDIFFFKIHAAFCYTTSLVTSSRLDESHPQSTSHYFIVWLMEIN